jgi:hypothetical protein
MKKKEYVLQPDGTVVEKEYYINYSLIAWEDRK